MIQAPAPNKALQPTGLAVLLARLVPSGNNPRGSANTHGGPAAERPIR